MQSADQPPSYLAVSTPLEPSIDSLLRAAVSGARHFLGPRLRAVVLTGSLARGEGVVAERQGSLALLSDIDLYALTADEHPPVDAPALLEAMRPADLPEWLRAPWDLSIVGHDYFARTGPTLPAAQAAHGFRTLFDSGEEWARPAAPASIDPEDALRLLLNRLLESLALESGLRIDGSRSWLAPYHDWKLRSDAILAFLSAFGCYEPSRQAQLGRVEQLARGLDEGVGTVLLDAVAELREFHRRMCSRPLRDNDFSNFSLGARDWARGFLDACLRRTMDPEPHDAETALLRSFGNSSSLLEEELGERWLRRRGAWGTLREARRWAPLAPPDVRPWWRYGWGGSGPDRVYWAGVQLLQGRAATSVEELLPAGARRILSNTDEGAVAQQVAKLWLQWILGEREG